VVFILKCYNSIIFVGVVFVSKNINGRAAAKNDDSHCEPM